MQIPPALPILAAALGVIACSGDGGSSGSGGAGGGGGAGGCPDATPHETFRLTIKTSEPADLPDDLVLSVSWSGGTEPEFVLADPTTHLTLEQDSNIECSAGESDGQSAVLCEVWTTGPTRFEITAADYDPIDETLNPELVEDCDVYQTATVELLMSEVQPES